MRMPGYDVERPHQPLEVVGERDAGHVAVGELGLELPLQIARLEPVRVVGDVVTLACERELADVRDRRPAAG